MTVHKDNLLTISQAAKSLGISKRTLQRWEKLDNFPQPYRTPGGSRRYSPSQLEEIKTWKGNKSQLPQNSSQLSISQAAQKLNVSPRTLQRWEKLANFPQPYRTPGGSRRYTPDQVNRIKTWHQQQQATSEQTSPSTPSAPTFTPPPPLNTPFLPSPYLDQSTPPLAEQPSPQPKKLSNTSKRLSLPSLAIIAGLLLLTLGLNPHSPVASISATGQANFTGLTLSNSSGQATLPAGEKTITVNHSSLTPYSQVIATFTSDYSPATKYWVTLDPANHSFTLHVDYPVNQDTPINYLIIN